MYKIKTKKGNIADTHQSEQNAYSCYFLNKHKRVLSRTRLSSTSLSENNMVKSISYTSYYVSISQHLLAILTCKFWLQEAVRCKA